MTFKMKALINKDKTRVLFAEIDYKFAALLFRFATSPLEQIMDAFVKHYGDNVPVIGSLSNLYNGFNKLCSVRYNNSISWSNAFGFPCGHPYVFRFPDLGYLRCEFGHQFYFCFPKIFPENESFAIFDDLRIVADCEGSLFKTVTNVGVLVAADMDFETRDVILGDDEIMQFLVSLLYSSSPLIETVLSTRVELEAKEESETGIASEKDAASNDKNMILKLTFHKSTNKLLFAKADELFISCLCSIFSIPVGRLGSYLGGHTCLNKLDNLQTSLIALAPQRYKNIKMKHESFPSDQVSLKNGELKTFMITDSLIVSPFSKFFAQKIFEEFKISDVKELELHIGHEEVLRILRASLTSTTALTDGLRLNKLMTQRIIKQEH